MACASKSNLPPLHWSWQRAMRQLLLTAKTMHAGQRTATLITELAKLAVLAWEGVGDEKGKATPVSPEGIEALMELWPVADAFEREYLAALYLLDAEKNV
jgi:hypothetical protein